MIAYRIWQIAGWTMLHYLWVGAALGTAALVVRFALRSAAANVRYLAALGSLLIMAAAPAVIAAVVANRLGPPPNDLPAAVADNEPVEDFPAATRDPHLPRVAPPEPLPPAPDDADKVAGTLRVPSAGRRITDALDAGVLYLPWLWLVGSPIALLLTTIGMAGAERLRRQSRPLADAAIADLCRRLAAALGVSRRVGVAVCDRIAGPVLVGVVRPVVLLPAVALASWDPQQLEMVLLHELLHVRRWDNLVNLLQRIVESLLFFHPLVWVVSAWVRREREHCCDAAVIAHTRQPQAYARLLVALAEQVSRTASANVRPAYPQVVSSMAQPSLVARIRRILKKEEQSMQVSRRILVLMFACFVIVAVAIGGYCARPTSAEDQSTVAAEPRNAKAEDSSNKTSAALASASSSSTTASNEKLSETRPAAEKSPKDGGEKHASDPGALLPADYLRLPGYGRLSRPDLRQHYGIDAAQEKKLREISAALLEAQHKLFEACKKTQKLPPDQRRAKREELVGKLDQNSESARKQIDDVLTAAQKAAYKQDSSYELAVGLGNDSQRMGRPLGIELSQEQKRQMDRLMEEVGENSGKRIQRMDERLLAVLTQQQRERLMARFTDTDVAAPDVNVPPFEGSVTNLVATLAEKQPRPFDFVFASEGGASVVIYPQLASPDVRKELGLNAEQDAKLQAILTKSQAAAQKLVARYEPKAGAPKPPPDKQKSKRAEYQRALEQFGKEVAGQIEAVLRPRQVAALKAIVRKNKVIDSLVRQDRTVLDDVHVSAEQRAKLRQIFAEFTAPDFSSQSAQGEKALGILTPEQRKKLDEAIERYGF